MVGPGGRITFGYLAHIPADAINGEREEFNDGLVYTWKGI
jgi:hypothetical protein